MAIEGPISELNLIDLFQILSFNQKTGILEIENGEKSKAYVYFEKGAVVYMHLDGYHIGLALIKSGIIKKEIYENEIMKKVGSNEIAIAKEIINKNIMSENEFRKFLKLRVEDMIYKLFEWREGYFKFEEGSFSLDSLFKFKIKTEGLIMEGSRRIDEWSRLASKIPSTAMIPILSDNTDKIDVIDMKPKEWEILSMINGVNSIKDVADRYGDEFEIAKLIYGMITLGIVKTEGENHSEIKLDNLARGKQYYDDGVYDKAIQELKQYIKENNTNIEAYTILCASFYALNQFDKINNYAELALSSGVDNDVIRKYNALAYFRRGEIEKSIEQWKNLFNKTSDENEKTKINELIFSLTKSIEIIKQLTGGESE